MARKPVRLPKRFPVGTKYVVEGTSNAEGAFRVSRRYVVLPNGRKVDLPSGPRSVRQVSSASSLVRKSGPVPGARGRTQRVSAGAL